MLTSSNNKIIAHTSGFGKPHLTNYYLKPILVIAPDLQFGAEIFASWSCKTCNADGKLKSSGWLDSYRYVHGIKSGINQIL
jgi:hypothetical protein